MRKNNAAGSSLPRFYVFRCKSNRYAGNKTAAVFTPFATALLSVDYVNGSGEGPKMISVRVVYINHIDLDSAIVAIIIGVSSLIAAALLNRASGCVGAGLVLTDGTACGVGSRAGQQGDIHPDNEVTVGAGFINKVGRCTVLSQWCS